MKATFITADGTKKGEIELPVQFQEEVRADLIKRAVFALQSHDRQPHGTDPEAGKKSANKISRRRRDYKTAYGIGISRVPRKIMSHSGTRFNWVGAMSPNTVGGFEAHPSKPEEVYAKKINIKERRKAIRSALAASLRKDLVEKRGHVVSEYPIVLDSAVESMTKTKEVLAYLTKLGLDAELERAGKSRMNTGKARRRGRPTQQRKGPLFVVSAKCGLEKAASNVPGVDVVQVKSINAELLAPGGQAGRLTLYTKGALEVLEKESLFLEKAPVKVKSK
ncbi:MAG: 50S ribosomal protein L4 [Nanoarchaeota archaeon]|nr:50S ribosomal protein L4 [Nanoarchaeota archaeon]